MKSHKVVRRQGSHSQLTDDSEVISLMCQLLFTPRKGRAIAQAVSRWLPTATARVRCQVMWDLWWTKWGQVFSEYFGFPCQSSFHQLLHNHLSSGAGTIGQQWLTYQVDSVLPHPEKLKKKQLPPRRLLALISVRD
jgi:hypothetical protein